MRIVAIQGHAFVTDFGAPVALASYDGSTHELPRYGIWRPDAARGMRPQVCHTTNDLVEAIEVLRSGLIPANVGS